MSDTAGQIGPGRRGELIAADEVASGDARTVVAAGRAYAVCNDAGPGEPSGLPAV